MPCNLPSIPPEFLAGAGIISCTVAVAVNVISKATLWCGKKVLNCAYKPDGNKKDLANWQHTLIKTAGYAFVGLGAFIATVNTLFLAASQTITILGLTAMVITNPVLGLVVAGVSSLAAIIMTVGFSTRSLVDNVDAALTMP